MWDAEDVAKHAEAEDVAKHAKDVTKHTLGTQILYTNKI